MDERIEQFLDNQLPQFKRFVSAYLALPEENRRDFEVNFRMMTRFLETPGLVDKRHTLQQALRGVVERFTQRGGPSQS